MRKLVRQDVTPGIARVGVEVDEVLLAARRLHATHAARALVEGDALFTRVPAVDVLHVRVLG